MTFLAYFGHLNIDITISVENIAIKGSATATGLNRSYGGTLGNFAIISSILGLDFHPYSAVSKETHKEFLNMLSERNVDISHISLFDNISGPVCYIISDQKEQNAYMFQGPMDAWRPDMDFDPDSYKYIHLSTGPPGPYLEIANSNSQISVFDPSQELFYKYSSESVRNFVRASQIVIGNRNEIQQIFDYLNLDIETNPRDFTVIMTDGINGSYVMKEGERIHIRARKSQRIVDTIGAGDAFRAGFYSAIYRGHSLVDSVVYANITASVAVSKKVTEFSTSWETIQDIYERERKNLVD